MDRGESSDNVDGSGASSKKKRKYETDNGQGVNRCTVFSIIAHVTLIKIL